MSVRWMTSKGVVAYHVAFAFLPGSNSTIALFLSQVAYWCQKADGGMAWLTHDRLREQTGLTREQQDQAAKRLTEMGVLEKKQVGIPAKIHYKIDFDQLEKLMLEAEEGTLNQGCGKPTTKGAGFPQPGLRESRNHTNKEIQDKTLEETLPPQPPKGGAPGGAGREKKSQVAHGLVDLWNQLAAEGTFPKARMTPPREGIFATRLKDPHWEADFRAAIAWIGTSPAAGWYRGENDRRWIADLDFMLQNGRATELAEKASVMDKAPEPAAAAPEAALPKWKTDRIAKCELAVTIAKRELTKLTAQGFTRATCPFRFKDADRELQKAQEALDAELGRPATENAATGPESGWDDE